MKPNTEDVEEICDACENSGMSQEEDILICLRSPAPPPTGVSEADLQAADIDPDMFYFAICDLERCPLSKW